MNTIERKLLALTFPTLDLVVLEELINATPNATVATEMMCGLYEEPKIPQHVWKDDTLRTFTDYNKWTGNVNYSYEREKVVYVYFPKGTKQEDVNKDNYLALSCPYGDDTVRLAITLDGFDIKTDYTDLKQWMKYHNAKPVNYASIEAVNAFCGFTKEDVEEAVTA